MSFESSKIQFPITMLGATGVGKTSMIAAMWNEFNRVSTDPSLELLPEKPTERTLDEQLKELQSVVSGSARPGTGSITGLGRRARLGLTASGVAQPQLGVKRTFEPRDYRLDFYHSGSQDRMQVVFRDYPGDWLDQGRQNYFHRVVTKLIDARVIMVAIDAPPLMESDDRNTAENRPEDIAVALKEAFRRAPMTDGQPPERLVLFVLMKGERWLRQNQGSEMLARFTRQFSQSLRHVSAYQSSTAAVVCPIQTLGAVQFVRYNAQGQPIFERIGNEDYSPVDCDQPLRYAMAFLTHALARNAEAERKVATTELNERRWWKRAKDTLLALLSGKTPEEKKRVDDWVKRSKALRSSVASFSQGCKQDDLFRVLQNPEILGVRRTL
jgi:hypothetical protein